MKRILGLSVALLLASSASADSLGGKVEVTAVPGWTLSAKPEPAPLPTLRYLPTDGRNATILLTLIPAGRVGVSDADSLRQFHRKACAPFLPSPDAPVPQKELKLATGSGVYASFEDPALIGKPSRPGHYKFATSASLWLGQDILVLATILCDDTGSAAFSEAMNIVRNTAVITAQAGAAPAKPIGTAGPLTLLPPPGFVRSEINASLSPGYFSYARPTDGVILSGWLDQAAKFKGMRTFWTAEKASLEANLGMKVANESFKIVAGWNVVSYDLPIGTDVQKNIRACRVYGGTWADVHLSQAGGGASIARLEAVLAEIKMAPAH